jgi:DNA-directed RNA polymerase subunit omega
MARVTIEDSIQKITSYYGRFELVVLSAQRARDLATGSEITIERDNDKDPVVALREIAEGNVSCANLQETFIKKHQNAQLLKQDNLTENKAKAVEDEKIHKEVEEEMKELQLTEGGAENDSEITLISNMYQDEQEITEE